MKLYNSTAGGGPLTNVHIINNYITENFEGVDAQNREDITGLVISQNFFDSNNRADDSQGIFLGAISSTNANAQITNNKFKDTDNGNHSRTAAINIAGNAGANPNGVSGLTISGNTSDNDGTFLVLSSVLNSAITGNTATNEANNGITVAVGNDNLTISNNTLSNASTGINFKGSIGLGLAGVTTNVAVEKNTITNMSTAAIIVASGAIGNGVSATNNIFKSNTADIVNQSTTAITTSGNTSDKDATPSANAPNTGFGSPEKNQFLALIALITLPFAAGATWYGFRRLARR